MTDLPPLPEPARTVDIYGRDIPMFTADQLRAYALAERAAERERCAQVCEMFNEDGSGKRLAAAIRGKRERSSIWTGGAEMEQKT